MQDLLDIINRVHIGCFKLCKNAINEYLPIAGNVGIFCQSEKQFALFTMLREQLCEPSSNPDQKYFKLIKPIAVESIEDIPGATYTYLYIRKPSVDSPELGDVDFVLSHEKYNELKQKVIASPQIIEGASVYNRPGWDTIEVRNSNIPALAYISTKEMAEKVRVKFD